MRVQCDVCERAAASVMCCADEAALCTECDTRVHAANKLANKHQRVPLFAAAEPSRCDICQDKASFFFCLEDRALLCRDCDVSIHSANVLSSGHQRFLVTGTRVALDALNNHESSETSGVEDMGREPLSKINTPPIAQSSRTLKHPCIGSSVLCNNPLARIPATTSRLTAAISSAVSGMSSSLGRRSSITDFLTEAIPNWRVDELLNIPDLADGYSLGDIASSKADAANLGDYDWTAGLSLFDEQVYAESFHEVPQLPCASNAPAARICALGKLGGTVKGKGKQDSAQVPEFDDAFIVPDLGLQSAPASPPVAKRRRQFLEV